MQARIQEKTSEDVVISLDVSVEKINPKAAWYIYATSNLNKDIKKIAILQRIYEGDIRPLNTCLRSIFLWTHSQFANERLSNFRDMRNVSNVDDNAEQIKAPIFKCNTTFCVVNTKG